MTLTQLTNKITVRGVLLTLALLAVAVLTSCTVTADGKNDTSHVVVVTVHDTEHILVHDTTHVTDTTRSTVRLVDTSHTSLALVDTTHTALALVDTLLSKLALVDTTRTQLQLVDTTRTRVAVVDTTHTALTLTDTVHTSVARTDTVYAVDSVVFRFTKYDTTHVPVVLTDTTHTTVAKVDTVLEFVEHLDTLTKTDTIIKPDTVITKVTVTKTDTLFTTDTVLKTDTVTQRIITSDTVFLQPGQTISLMQGDSVVIPVRVYLPDSLKVDTTELLQMSAMPDTVSGLHILDWPSEVGEYNTFFGHTYLGRLMPDYGGQGTWLVYRYLVSDPDPSVMRHDCTTYPSEAAAMTALGAGPNAITYAADRKLMTVTAQGCLIP